MLFFQEYCRGNTEDINNNIVEFKEAVQVRGAVYKCTFKKRVLCRLPMWSSTTKLLDVARILSGAGQTSGQTLRRLGTKQFRMMEEAPKNYPVCQLMKN